MSVILLSLFSLQPRDTFAFTPYTLQLRPTPSISFYIENTLCENINFLTDNQIDIMIDKLVCEESESAEDCLDSLIDIPERQNSAIIYYSFKKFESMSADWNAYKKSSPQDYLLKLNCYSLKINQDTELGPLAQNSEALFDRDLPALVSQLNPEELQRLAKAWAPFIKDKLYKKEFFLNLNKVSDENFKYFLISNYLDNSYYENLLPIDKYKLSMDILNNSLALKRPIEMHLKLKIINYIDSRDISWDFPTELIIKFSNDPDFEKLFVKMFKKTELESAMPFWKYYSETFESLLLSSQTAMETRCSLLQNLYTVIKKSNTFNDQVNEMVSSLSKLNIPCLNKIRNNLLSYNSASIEYQIKWCPTHRQCALHFSTGLWKEKFSYCQKDEECKSLKYDGCERIFFTDQLPREEIEIYHNFCKTIVGTLKDNISNTKQAVVCLDNTCQAKRE